MTPLEPKTLVGIQPRHLKMMQFTLLSISTCYAIRPKKVKK